jgi:hypothetical protein
LAAAGVFSYAFPVYAQSTNGELQPAELTGTVHSESGQSYLNVGGERYEMYFQNSSERRAAQDLNGHEVRIDGDIDRRWQPRKNVLWVDRVYPAPEYEYAAKHRETRQYVDPAEDQPVGDSHFRGKDVLDMPFRGPENPTIVPRLHLSW